MNDFWENQVDPGYYDEVLLNGLKKKSGIQSNWHNLTFLKIAKKINSESNHLDYACGPGTFIGNYLKSESLGVDISEQQIEYANNQYSEFGTFMTTGEFNLENYFETYDVITIIGLLEFITEDEAIKLIDDLYSLLKPEGKIFITTPNYRGLMYLLEKLVNLFSDVNYQNQHISRYNKSNIKKILEKSSFKEVKVKKIINLGVSFSIFNHKMGKVVEKFIETLFNNFFGFILLVELKK